MFFGRDIHSYVNQIEAVANEINRITNIEAIRSIKGEPYKNKDNQQSIYLLVELYSASDQKKILEQNWSKSFGSGARALEIKPQFIISAIIPARFEDELNKTINL